MFNAIFPSLEGESLEDFAIRLAERWRIGDKKLDNGVILLVFVQERRIRLEVGYGLEPVLPDAVASQIIREQIGPRFREGRWADGLMGAVDAVFARIDSKGATVPRPPPGHTFGVSPLTLGLLVVFGLVALMLMREVSRGGGQRNAYSAGGRRGWGPPPVFFPPMGGGGRWGGGGGGGGGFSGGGGSFGGGGASGDW